VFPSVFQLQHCLKTTERARRSRSTSIQADDEQAVLPDGGEAAGLVGVGDLVVFQEGKRLISVYPKDLPALDHLLIAKLSLFGFRV
jgi:hypothetical protein